MAWHYIHDAFIYGKRMPQYIDLLGVSCLIHQARYIQIIFIFNGHSLNSSDPKHITRDEVSLLVIVCHLSGKIEENNNAGFFFQRCLPVFLLLIFPHTFYSLMFVPKHTNVKFFFPSTSWSKQPTLVSPLTEKGQVSFQSH